MAIWPAGVSVGATGPTHSVPNRVMLTSGSLELLTAEEARAVAAELVRRAEDLEASAAPTPGACDHPAALRKHFDLWAAGPEPTSSVEWCGGCGAQRRAYRAGPATGGSAEAWVGVKREREAGVRETQGRPQEGRVVAPCTACGGIMTSLYRCTNVACQDEMICSARPPLREVTSPPRPHEVSAVDLADYRKDRLVWQEILSDLRERGFDVVRKRMQEERADLETVLEQKRDPNRTGCRCVCSQCIRRVTVHSMCDYNCDLRRRRATPPSPEERAGHQLVTVGETPRQIGRNRWEDEEKASGDLNELREDFQRHLYAKPPVKMLASKKNPCVCGEVWDHWCHQQPTGEERNGD